MKSTDDIGREVITALANGMAMTVEVLRRRLGVRRQRLFEVLAALEEAALVEGNIALLVAKDGKRRWHRVYSLPEDTRQPRSHSWEAGSHIESGGLDADGGV